MLYLTFRSSHGFEKVTGQKKIKKKVQTYLESFFFFNMRPSCSSVNKTTIQYVVATTKTKSPEKPSQFQNYHFTIELIVRGDGLTNKILKLECKREQYANLQFVYANLLPQLVTTLQQRSRPFHCRKKLRKRQRDCSKYFKSNGLRR